MKNTFAPAHHHIDYGTEGWDVVWGCGSGREEGFDGRTHLLVVAMVVAHGIGIRGGRRWRRRRR